MNQLIDTKQLHAILTSYGVTNIKVFGSFARGDANTDSDLDLLVTYRSGTNIFDIMSLQDELEQFLSRRVDLVSEKYIQPRLAKRIKNELKPLAAL